MRQSPIRDLGLVQPKDLELLHPLKRLEAFVGHLLTG
jgi:hypothetical protein